MNTLFFTRDGDSGKSGFGAKKIKKDDALFDALGALDSVNSLVGWCAVAANKKVPKLHRDLLAVQEMIFIAQAELAGIGFGMKSAQMIDMTSIKRLETMILNIDATLPPLKQFVLPGGSELAARLDIARTAVRDAERAVVRLSTKKKCPPELLIFMNRLSSVLFAFARFANFKLGMKEKNPSYQ